MTPSDPGAAPPSHSTTHTDHARRRLRLLDLVAQRDWVPVAGYGFCVTLLTAGYYYNLTFVQLGLIDLGTTRLGMTDGGVSLIMALLAWSRLPSPSSPAWSWTAAGGVATCGSSCSCAATIGVAMPVTFSFMADLIPVRDRGFAAAIPAGLAFFVAALYPQQWRLVEFSVVMSAVMAPAIVVLATLAFRPSRLVDRLAHQHARFGPGRFTRPPAPAASTPAFALIVAAMFAVFFIDSLGIPDAVPPLLLPGFYVLAVSFYTTLNFALWPDLSTGVTIGTRCAVGVGVAGWLASFLSTALALWSDAAGVSLLTHLRYVDALALVLVAAVPLLLYGRRVRRLAREETT